MGWGGGGVHVFFSFIYVEYNWHWSVTATRNFHAVPRQTQLQWRPVQWQKKSEHDSFRRTATSGGNLSRSPFAELGDREVSPSSATATNFKMRGGRYRRPRQKSVAHFGDRYKKVSPTSATATSGIATKKCELYHRSRQGRFGLWFNLLLIVFEEQTNVFSFLFYVHFSHV